jgi:Metallo-peptidase family M12B Reprolysin-like
MFASIIPLRPMFNHHTTRSRARRRGPTGRVLEFLEERKLMTVSDVADAAALVGHVTPGTHLYLNFDGGTVPTDFTGKNFDTVQPFETAAGDTNLTHRDDDIQDILYQVSEVFAPFDVQVVRAYGPSNYAQANGDTTIFIGSNSDTSSTSITQKPFNYTKSSHSFTPNAFVDIQTDANVNFSTILGSLHVSALDHRINSDLYDIGFIDPTYGITSDPTKTVSCLSTISTRAQPTHADVATIRAAIVHEAGHTFGLSHVRTDGGTDNTALGAGSTSDVMSYDSPNLYFANKSLTVTSANFNGLTTTFGAATPHYYDQNARRDVALTTQNSFLALDRVLGARAQNEGTSLVADNSLVDPSVPTSRVDLSGQTIHFGDIARQGDYQAYSFTTAVSGINYESVAVKANTGNLNPILMVYDSSGTNLLSVSHAHNGVAGISNLQAGRAYILVVGASGGVTTGYYDVTITHGSAFDNLVSLEARLRASGQSDSIVNSSYLGTLAGLPVANPDDLLDADYANANALLRSGQLTEADMNLIALEGARANESDATPLDLRSLSTTGPLAPSSNIHSTSQGIPKHGKAFKQPKPHLISKAQLKLVPHGPLNTTTGRKLS